MSLKSTLAGAAAAALVVAAPAATAFADNPSHSHGHSHSQSAAAEGHHGKSKSHFAANGKVTAVDDSTFTMHVKGGSKDLHGTDVTVSLADNAKVRRDGKKAQLSDLQVGDRVTAVGHRGEDGSLTARHVKAHGPNADDSTEAADDNGTDAGSTDDNGTDAGSTDSGDDTGTDAGSTDTGGTDTGTDG